MGMKIFLDFIAEDLGEITPDVDAFREDLGFMGEIGTTLGSS